MRVTYEALATVFALAHAETGSIAHALHVVDLARSDVAQSLKRTSMSETLRAVTEYYGVSIGRVMSSSRARELVRVRHMAMYLLRRQGHSYPEIGRFLDRDHTTCIHGFRMIISDPDPELHRVAETLLQKLEAR